MLFGNGYIRFCSTKQIKLIKNTTKKLNPTNGSTNSLFIDLENQPTSTKDLINLQVKSLFCFFQLRVEVIWKPNCDYVLPWLVPQPNPEEPPETQKILNTSDTNCLIKFCC